MEQHKPEDGSTTGGNSDGGTGGTAAGADACTGGGTGDGKPGWSARIASGAAAATRAASAIKPVAARFGDWLARIGWGKFFVLAVLLLILGGMATSLVFRKEPIVVLDEAPAGKRAKVTVVQKKDGLHVKSGEEADKANIKIDRRGVRIDAKDEKDHVAVIVDEKGVRIERSDAADADKAAAAAAPPASASPAVPPLPPLPPVPAPPDSKSEVTISAADLADPDKAEAAVEAARARIEEIISDKIERQVARRTRQVQSQRGDWIMSFVLLLITSLIIVKIALGSKRKAETQAQAATATAAEESLKRQLAEAQLKTMQAQVEPHFLFNTLASVDYLIETDPQRASTMQKNLIQYLRAALPKMRGASSTLGKEVDLCRAYLEILKVRMEDRLQVAITVPQGLESAVFPPMMLQSLVENAIKHGLEPKPEGGTLSLSADIANGKLRVTVADTGLGFGAPGGGGGVGLSNVRERLAALYGSAAQLTMTANSPGGTIATIEVPYTFEAAAGTAAAA